MNVFEGRPFRRLKSKNWKIRKEKVRQAIAEHYNKKRLLCDKCGLCKLSVEEITKNYDEILERLTALLDG